MKQPVKAALDKRRAGERERLLHSAERMRATLANLTLGLKIRGPIGAETANAVMTTATEISMQIARHDAFLLAEEDVS